MKDTKFLEICAATRLSFGNSILRKCCRELKLIKCEFIPHEVNFSMKNNFSLNGMDEYSGPIYGGEVGVLLDGRGRLFDFNNFSDNRIELIKSWSKETNEYPN